MHNRTALAGRTFTPDPRHSNDTTSLNYATPNLSRKKRREVNPWLSAIAILAMIALFLSQAFSFRGRGDDARRAATKTDLANIESALATFEVDTGRYPTNLEGLQALLSAPPGETNWHGPYLQHPPIDPWGHPYVYHCPAKTSYELFSAGPDGKPGTADDIVVQ
jgi:general secretion pathway protein G